MFLNTWRQREQDMQQHSGFVDFKLEQEGDKFVVSSRSVCSPRGTATASSAHISRSKH
jgi:hypothetical protein